MNKERQSVSLRRQFDMLAAGIILHNLEEYRGFEDYFHRHGLRITRLQLQIALILATILPITLILIARDSPKHSRRMWVGFFVPAIFAANALNHIGQTIVLRDYSPGTATALVLNVPLAFSLYRQVLRDGSLTAQQVMQTLLGGTLVMFPSIMLFQGIGWIGARLWSVIHDT